MGLPASSRLNIGTGTLTSVGAAVGLGEGLGLGQTQQSGVFLDTPDMHRTLAGEGELVITGCGLLVEGGGGW